MNGDVARAIAAHRDAGSMFRAGGIESFVRSEGDGEVVVLIHGLPASSFLYRKVVPELAAQRLHAVAFDLPGLGLAERPASYDYSIAGLGRFAAVAVDALGLERFHLVVHDAGGPVGFELVGRRPERILSLTVTNTVVELPSAPFPGEVLARFGQRVPAWMASQWLWRQMMYRVGILDRSAVPVAEVDAYRELALGSDRGVAYLQIMRSLRPKDGRPVDYRAVLDTSRTPYPVQIIWGADDPVLPLKRYGWKALRWAKLPQLFALPARHFLHEDQAAAIAQLVASFVRSAAER